jgi:TolB-like protein/DNA-binding winged helix-turn-helix (wHTH) protein
VVQRFTFDDVQIDVQGFRLLKHGKAVSVEPKALNLLIFLVGNPGRLVERRELIDAVWGDTFVTDHVLNYSIGQLRKALTDDAKNPRYIETVPTRGYRFIAEVQVEDPEAEGSSSSASVLEASASKTEVKQDVRTESINGVAGEPARFYRNRLGFRVAIALGFGLLAMAGLVTYWMKRSAGHISGSAPIRSLAVLPLENMSGDSSQEYLADGMTDELITGLDQIGALRVISRTTAMQYKNPHKSLPQIAKDLNVEAVVEGSVVRSGDRIRIAAQLIDAQDDKQLWANSFEGDMRNVLELQNHVASAVAAQIRIEITSKEQTELSDAHQVIPAAYEAFLKGHFFEQNSPETLQKSIDYYRQAVALDPQFVRAYVGIARSANFLANWQVIPRGEAAATSDAMIAKALELDPDSGEAYAERAWSRMLFHWDFPGAKKDFERAFELSPGSGDIQDGMAAYSALMGQADESVKHGRRALSLDPLSLLVNTDYCLTLWVNRKYDEAIGQCNAALELDPNYKYALSYLGDFYGIMHEYSEAHKIWERYGGCDALCTAMRDEIHGAPGVHGAFDAWLKTQKKPPDPLFLAEAYAGLGRKDHAFASLEKAYEERSGGDDLTYLPVEPAFDPLRSDPRFDAFLQRVGLPPQSHIGAAQLRAN